MIEFFLEINFENFLPTYLRRLVVAVVLKTQLMLICKLLLKYKNYVL